MRVMRERLDYVQKENCQKKTRSTSFCDNNDEDLKMLGLTPIEYLFANLDLEKEGTGDE